MTRGWCSVDVCARGDKFCYICTHLEEETFPQIQVIFCILPWGWLHPCQGRADRSGPKARAAAVVALGSCGLGGRIAHRAGAVRLSHEIGAANAPATENCAAVSVAQPPVRPHLRNRAGRPGKPRRGGQSSRIPDQEISRFRVRRLRPRTLGGTAQSTGAEAGSGNQNATPSFMRNRQTGKK